MQKLDVSILREVVEKIYISQAYTPDENEPRIKAGKQGSNPKEPKKKTGVA